MGKPFLSPDDLTENERVTRILELLTIASVRMARELMFPPSNPIPSPTEISEVVAQSDGP